MVACRRISTNVTSISSGFRLAHSAVLCAAIDELYRNCSTGIANKHFALIALLALGFSFHPGAIFRGVPCSTELVGNKCEHYRCALSSCTRSVPIGYRRASSELEVENFRYQHSFPE